ncbi:MAG: GTPase [bacterium]|nr:GTPase [bacterium]
MLTIALIGRTNVGKSTLFNRIIGRAKALTSEIPHTTRDRNVATTTWRGVELRVIDTGGVESLQPKAASRKPLAPALGRSEIPSPRGTGGGRLPAEVRGRGWGSKKSIEGEIHAQAERAVKDADMLVLVTDVREGLLSGERAISRYLRTLGKPIVVVGNKASTERQRLACQEFSALGLGPVSPVAAITGAGVGDLLDRVVGDQAIERAGMRTEELPEPSLPEALQPSSLTTATRVAIVGEPNVGKSSLLNAILGRDEAIVLPEPFTTRDVHDVDVEIDGRTVTLLDTAGIRRLATRAVKWTGTRLEEIERLAVRRSLAAIERSEVVILVLDATRPATRHTKHLAQAIVDAGRAGMIVVNKADLISNFDPESVIENTHALFPHLSWAPVIATSALIGGGTRGLLPAALRADAAWKRKLSSEALAAVHGTVKRRIPTAKTSFGRKRSHLLELQQTAITPPTFLLVTRRRIRLPKAIPAIVERAIREHADFEGTPIRIVVKSSKV